MLSGGIVEIPLTLGMGLILDPLEEQFLAKFDTTHGTRRII